MGWLAPDSAPTTGRFIAKFRSRNDRNRMVVLERSHTATGSVIGVAGGLFEWDMGEMVGWHPLPDGLND